MLHTGIGLDTVRPVAWWAPGALYAADFRNDRYMRDQVAIPAGDAHWVERAAPKFVADGAGTWRRFGPNVPARTDLGLHLDPAVTYAGHNAALAGAVPGVVGAAGQRPTGWSPGTTAGLNIEIIGTAEDNGVPYIRVRLYGTTDSTDMQWMFDESTVVAAAGQTWTGVLLVRHVAGSLGGISPAVRLAEQAGASFLVSSQEPVAIGPAFTLGSVTRLFDNPATTRARMRLRLTFATVGQAVDVTLDMALPSMAASPAPILPHISELGVLDRPTDVAHLASMPTATTIELSLTSGMESVPATSSSPDWSLSPSEVVRALIAY
jgi:hypothetical protein